MRIAVLARADSWYLADLRRAAGDRHEVAAVSFRGIASAVGVDGSDAERSHAERGNEVERSPLDHENELESKPAIHSGGTDLRRFDTVLVRAMPPGSLEQVVFRMDALARLEAAGVPVINPPRAIECAVDKYLTTARLAEAGLPIPRTIACQTVDDAMQAFAALGGDVVVKPLFGSEGRGIARLNDAALAERAFGLLAGLGSVLYLQEFVPHDGFDLRLLIVGRHALAVRRSNSLDWRTNVSRGATAEAVEPGEDWAELARRAAAVVGASVAGVDLLPGRDGRMYVLEVNAVPGWRALAAAQQCDVAALVLEHVENMAQARVDAEVLRRSF